MSKKKKKSVIASLDLKNYKPKYTDPYGDGTARPVVDEELTPQAAAYVRARGADRMSSYGDFAILSDECDESTANYLKREVSDGIIAPSYSEKALEILKSKRKGTYLILKMSENYQPESLERKQVFGVTFEQLRNDIKISRTRRKEIC